MKGVKTFGTIKCHFNIWSTLIAELRQLNHFESNMTRQKGKQLNSYHITNTPFTLGAATVVTINILYCVRCAISLHRSFSTVSVALLYRPHSFVIVFIFVCHFIHMTHDYYSASMSLAYKKPGRRCDSEKQ